ncbi:hypothetical protein [Silvimonas sp.]|uniref:hypothetical protein n=1 Tax=Silvimonas sp. TaxID=2650811 RepID=UPI00284DF32C|nr:hypothetical protein [Silvimonas sp.]MDR3429341.1 hypothetical protein [Silvimonas sp.]
MSTTPLSPEILTGETGGLHTHLDTLESALDYALAKKESPKTPNPETWQVTFNVLSRAADSKNPSDIENAREQLARAVGETLRATGKEAY